MTRIRLHNEPRLKLLDLLRRRKTTLPAFMKAHGIVTYDGIVLECRRIGVGAPTEDEYNAARREAGLENVSSPQEGIVVLEPPAVIDEATGRPIDPEAPVVLPGVSVVTGITEQPKPKSHKNHK